MNPPWIPILSALIVALGWFVTAYFNRRKDVAAKRLEYRLKALNSVLSVWIEIQKNPAPFTNPAFLPLLEDARFSIQLYGLRDEIETIESFVTALEARNLAQIESALNVLVPLVRNQVRKELGIK